MTPAQVNRKQTLLNLISINGTPASLKGDQINSTLLYSQEMFLPSMCEESKSKYVHSPSSVKQLHLTYIVQASFHPLRLIKTNLISNSELLRQQHFSIFTPGDFLFHIVPKPSHLNISFSHCTCVFEFISVSAGSVSTPQPHTHSVDGGGVRGLFPEAGLLSLLTP